MIFESLSKEEQDKRISDMLVLRKEFDKNKEEIRNLQLKNRDLENKMQELVYYWYTYDDNGKCREIPFYCNCKRDCTCQSI